MTLKQKALARRSGMDARNNAGKNVRTTKSSSMVAGWKTLGDDISRRLWLLNSDSLCAENQIADV